MTEIRSVQVRTAYIMIVVMDKLFLFAIADIKCICAVLPPSLMISSVMSNSDVRTSNKTNVMFFWRLTDEETPCVGLIFSIKVVSKLLVQ